MLEADLYDPTLKFVTTTLGCWTARVKAGVADVGEIDILGVRYVGGDLSAQTEVVAVEVKPSTARFAVSAGQAHGYSVLADRCYLAAVTNGFTPNQVMIASRLGVGLIRIKVLPSGRVRFDEVLSAPSGQPVEEMRLQAVEKLGLGSCSICGGIFQRADVAPDDYKNVVRGIKRGQLAVAAQKELGLMWWLSEQAAEHGRMRSAGATKVRRYLCPDCVWALAPS